MQMKRTIKSVTLTADPKGITLTYRGQNILLPAEEDQWGEEEAEELLNNLSRMYSSFHSETDMIDHFDKMVYEGL